MESMDLVDSMESMDFTEFMDFMEFMERAWGSHYDSHLIIPIPPSQRNWEKSPREAGILT